MPADYKELIGVISDTHGLLRPEAVAALAGCDRIIHAGDIDDPSLLADLEKIAPVVAVRGNVDRGPWADSLPENLVLEAGAVSLYVIHDLGRLEVNPAKAGVHVVIYGHSHKPSEQFEDGVLYLNPGSAGPRRFQLPICLARLRVSGSNLSVEFIELLRSQHMPR